MISKDSFKSGKSIYDFIVDNVEDYDVAVAAARIILPASVLKRFKIELSKLDPPAKKVVTKKVIKSTKGKGGRPNPFA
jgi:hypothetical protein